MDLFFGMDKFSEKNRYSSLDFSFPKGSLPGLISAILFTLVSSPAFAASTGDLYLNTSSGTTALFSKIGILLIEILIFGINSGFIMSDMRVIMWFEKKKRVRV